MKKWVVFLIVVLLLLMIFFFPKRYIKGGFGGFMGFYNIGDKSYKEVYKCLGFKYDYYPLGCSDCATSHLCLGVRYGKECYLEIYNLPMTYPRISQESTQCK